MRFDIIWNVKSAFLQKRCFLRCQWLAFWIEHADLDSAAKEGVFAAIDKRFVFHTRHICSLAGRIDVSLHCEHRKLVGGDGIIFRSQLNKVRKGVLAFPLLREDVSLNKYQRRKEKEVFAYMSEHAVVFNWVIPIHWEIIQGN